MNKKIFLYEIDPLFFYDENDDGYGDFQGLNKKIDYFNFLNIDAILLVDIFNQENIIIKKPEESIYDKYGNFKELKLLVKNLKKYQINLFVEVDLKNILNSMIIKTTIEDFKSNHISKYIEQFGDANDKSLEWNTKNRIDAFKKIISFWKNIGVTKFVFSNFETIYENNNKLDAKLIDQLKIFYQLAKEIDENIEIGLRSLFFKTNTVNLIFKKYIGVFCNWYIDSSYSLIGCDKNHPFDIQKKFNQKYLFQKIKKLKIKNEDFHRYIISFNNNRIGRVNSRWLQEQNLIDESNKCLLMLTNILPFSSVNYFGDEIGQLRLKDINPNKKYNYHYIERKRYIESKKYDVWDFEESQKSLSRINTQSIFVWNSSPNGGFSKAKNLFRSLPINYQSHNLINEYEDPNSIVNFYKKIMQLSRNLKKFENKIKIFFYKKITIIKFYEETYSIMFLINLSNQTIDKKISNKWKVVMSTIANKEYLHKTTCLSPYESLILIKMKKKKSLKK